MPALSTRVHYRRCDEPHPSIHSLVLWPPLSSSSSTQRRQPNQTNRDKVLVRLMMIKRSWWWWSSWPWMGAYRCSLALVCTANDGKLVGQFSAKRTFCRCRWPGRTQIEFVHQELLRKLREWARMGYLSDQCARPVCASWLDLVWMDKMVTMCWVELVECWAGVSLQPLPPPSLWSSPSSWPDH